jgi:hypothetical protein
MAAAPIEIPIKLGGLAKLKSELRDIKDELAGLSPNTEKWVELQDKAGDISKKIKSINSGISDLSKGSNIEQVSDSFKGLGNSLMNLDFSGAAKQAARFNQTIGSLSSADITKPFKAMISTIGTLSKAFVQIGVTILANPLFLLVAAIVAIVAIIGVVMNKLGILKPVLDAVGKVFGWIGDAINMVIQGFKDLTDWLGLTSNAAADATEKEKKLAEAQEKSAIATEKYNKKIDERVALEKELKAVETGGQVDKENQLKLLEARGASIEQIFEYRTKLTLDRLTELENAEFNSGRIFNEREKAANIKEIKATQTELQVMQYEYSNTYRENEKKEAEDAAKRASDSYKARIEAEKQFQSNRLAAIRQIEDIETSLMEDGVQKELKLNELKYQRILQDLLTNEKLIDTEKKRLKNLYEAEYAKTQDEINAKELARINKFTIDANKLKQDAETAWLQTVEDIAEQNYVNSLSEKDRELLAVNDKYFALQEAAKGNAEQLAIIEAAKATEVGAINDKAAKDEIARIQAVAQAKAAIQNEDLDRVNAGIGVLKSIFEKNKGVQKAALIAENAIGVAKVIISTAAANAAALATPQAIATSGAAAIPVIARNKISAGISIASIVASTAKGLSALGGGGTVSGTAPGGGGGTSTSQATPQVNLFGANNNANTFGANGQQSNQGGEMVVKAVVVESDVTSMQKKMNKVQESAVL